MPYDISGRGGSRAIKWDHGCIYCGSYLPPVSSVIVICAKCGARHEIIDKQ